MLIAAVYASGIAVIPTIPAFGYEGNLGNRDPLLRDQILNAYGGIPSGFVSYGVPGLLKYPALGGYYGGGLLGYPFGGRILAK